MRLLKICAAGAAVLSLASVGHAAPPAKLLSLSQAASQSALDKIPVCSESVTTNCKKRRSNGAWIIVGSAAIIAAVALATSDDKNSVSP